MLPKRFAFGGYPNAMLAKTATSWEKENGPHFLGYDGDDDDDGVFEIYP